MGIFGRRNKQPQPQPPDRTEWVTSTARRILAERGVETTVEHGAQPEDVALLAADGMYYPLFNALAKTHGASADDASAIIATHLDNLLVAQQGPSLDQLSAEQLRQQVRTRLLADRTDPDGPTFEYARQFSDGLIVALCIDFPESVVILNDKNMETLTLGVEELYSFGQLNTDGEPIDETFEPSPGIMAIVGDSLFTASKAANLPAVLGAAPFGTLFTVPHRHMLIALPIAGPETLKAVEYLIGITRQVLGNGPAPGGVLSPDVHFSRDRIVNRVSSTDNAGAVSIEVDERLQQALEEAIG